MKTLLLTLIFIVSVSLSFAQDTCPAEDQFHKYLDVNVDFNDPGVGTYKFHYKLQNGFDSDKKTLIMLHGGPGEGMNGFDKCPGSYCLSELAEQYNIVTVDERGAGCSKLPEKHHVNYMTINETVMDIESLRRHLVGEKGKVTIYGISFGSVVAVIYTSKFDHVVEKMILEGAISDNAYMLNLAFDRFFDAMLDMKPDVKKAYLTLKEKLEAGKLKITYEDFREMARASTYAYRLLFKVMPKMINELNNEVYTIWDALEKAFGDLGEMLDKAPAYTYIMCRELFDFDFTEMMHYEHFVKRCEAFREVNKQFPKYDSRNFTPNIKTPSLIIVGQWDGPAPPMHSKIIDKNLTTSRHFVVPFAGHGVQWERRKCATSLMSNFLKTGLTEKLTQVFKSDICQKEKI